MLTRLTLLFTAAAVAMLAGRAPAEEPPKRYITVTGTATIRSMPDTVNWALTLRDEHLDLKTAKAANDKKLQALAALREELKLAPGEFETGQVSIGREYHRRGEREGDFRHHVVHRTVRIVQRDMKRFDEFFEKIVARTDLELDMNLECSKEIELRKQARLQAVKAAKDKAAAMAGVLEAKLGKVSSLSEGSSRQWWRSALSNTSSGDEAPAEDAAGGTFAPGALLITVSVEATFELE